MMFLWWTQLWLVVVLVHGVVAKFGFVKDQSMDEVFPGPVYRQDPSLPEGHMRPLGWQRRPDGPITEQLEVPAAKEFYEQYVRANSPVVFRNAVSDAPVFTTWQEDKYLIEKYGNLDVEVRHRSVRKRDRIETTEEIIKFKKFLYDYMYDDCYLATAIPTPMMQELPFPKCVRCGTIGKSLISAHLWMSSGGTSSLIHSHDNHLLYCVLFGRRDFILIDRSHKKYVDFVEDYPGSLSGHSNINTYRLNMYAFKNIGRVPWIWSTLYPGDCIFVPAGYIHHVRSLGRSLSLTIEFATMVDFDDTGCTLIEEDFAPLSDASFLLTFNKGILRLSKTPVSAEDVRHLLVLLMGKEGILTINKFEKFYNRVIAHGNQDSQAQRLFYNLISEEEESQVTIMDLMNIPIENLQEIADIISSAYGDLVPEEEGHNRFNLHEEF
ncbi:uncharacterized protein LOC131940532 [Physella acuta]|uniref:uncharacterized protein LOC131940532 n=1 Tax=Physella acuta TaxID=109671 RepID=UPI0027DD415F|nr:uncharacterized protein LOC131940532 [Physella acuta]